MHGVFAASLCVFLVLQPYIREGDGTLFLAFVAVALSYALLTARAVQVKPLLGFTAVCLVYILFSSLDVLPDAWTHVYAPDLIFRQSFYGVLLYPLVLSFASLIDYLSRYGLLMRFLAIAFLCIAILGTAVSIMAGETTVGVEAIAQLFSRGIGNARLFLYVGLTYILFYWTRSWWSLATSAVCIAAVLLSIMMVKLVGPQMQNMVVLAAVLVVALFPLRRRVLAWVAGVWIVGYLALMPIAGAIYQHDANAGFRLVLSRDAIAGVIASNGIGIGYGKEVVTGTYSEDGIPRDLERFGERELALQGVHNSIAQEYLRLGILGGTFLAWLVFVTCFPPRYGSERERRHLAVVYMLVIVAVTMNVGIESPTYIVGLAFAIGYILARKSLADARAGLVSNG